jgi:hypothetical protein
VFDKNLVHAIIGGEDPDSLRRIYAAAATAGAVLGRTRAASHSQASDTN